MNKHLSIILAITLCLCFFVIGCDKNDVESKPPKNANSILETQNAEDVNSHGEEIKKQTVTGTYVCEYKDYVFYRNTNDNGSLYRYNIKNDSYIKLFGENAYPFLHSIKVFDEQVYFVTRTETDTSPTLYRVSINGGEAERLIENVCDDFAVTEDAIYYTGYQCPNHSFADYQLHKYTFADKKSDILLDERCYQQFNLIDNKIYCLVLNSNGSDYGLAYFDIETQTTAEIDTGELNNFTYAISANNGKVIYLNINNLLCTYNTETKEFKEIANDFEKIGLMAVANDELMYFIANKNKVYQYKDATISEYEDRQFEFFGILELVDNKPIMVNPSNTNGNKIAGDNRLNVVVGE